MSNSNYPNPKSLEEFFASNDIPDPAAIRPTAKNTGIREGRVMLGWTRVRFKSGELGLRSAAIFLIALILIGVLLALDGFREFLFIAYTWPILDAIRWIYRVAYKKIFSFPRIPLLWLPFTTVWLLAVVLPAFVYQLTPLLWACYHVSIATWIYIELAYRLTDHYTEYCLHHYALAVKTIEKWRSVLKNRWRYFFDGEFAVDPADPNIGAADREPDGISRKRIKLRTFDKLVNQFLRFRVWHGFILPAVIAVAFVFIVLAADVGFAEKHIEQNGGDNRENIALAFDAAVRLFFPVCTILVTGLGLLTSFKMRKKITATLRAILVFRGSPRDKKYPVPWSARGQSGSALDRSSYTLWAFVLIAAVGVQLNSGPVFMESMRISQDDSYVLSGSKAFAKFRHPYPGWELNTTQTSLLIAVHFTLPLTLFFGLTYLIGRRLHVSNCLFEDNDAYEHEFDVLIEVDDDPSGNERKERTESTK